MFHAQPVYMAHRRDSKGFPVSRRQMRHRQMETRRQRLQRELFREIVEYVKPDSLQRQRDRFRLPFAETVQFVEEQFHQLPLEEQVRLAPGELIAEQCQVFCKDPAGIRGNRNAGRNGKFRQILLDLRTVENDPRMVPRCRRIAVPVHGSGRPELNRLLTPHLFRSSGVQHDRVVKEDQQPRPGIGGLLAMADQCGRHELIQGQTANQKMPPRGIPWRDIVVK